MNGLALCAGIGGLERGLVHAFPAWRTVAWVERDPDAQAILRAAMRRGDFAEAPLYDTLEAFPAAEWHGRVDAISAGIPCQPFSASGRRRGLADARWLWPLVRDILDATGARVLALENVPPFVRAGLPAVLGDLADRGWDAEWGLLPASAVGAPHRRLRLFLLAHRQGGDGGLLVQRRGSRAAGAELGGRGEGVADADKEHGNTGGFGAGHVRRERSASPEVCGFLAESASGDARGSRRGRAAPDDPVGVGDAYEGVRRWRPDAPGLQDGRPGAEPRAFPAPWPPSPADRDAWAGILATDPGCAPALAQPRLRRVADELPEGLDRMGRAARLRCLGNAVVAACAAEAFRQLAGRLGWTMSAPRPASGGGGQGLVWDTSPKGANFLNVGTCDHACCVVGHGDAPCPRHEPPEEVKP